MDQDEIEEVNREIYAQYMRELQRKDRRRRIFEQVAMALLDRGDIDTSESITRKTTEQWAKDTVSCAKVYAEAFISAADEFAEKEIEK
jgi:hypothetical protein